MYSILLKIPRQNYVTKYQHEERYKPTTCHIERKITMRHKFQMAHNASNINHIEKNIF